MKGEITINTLLNEYICYLSRNGIDYYKLSSFEKKVIDQMIYSGRQSYLEYNKKGHLIFRQRYPNLPLYISILTLIINIIVYLFIFVNM